MQWIDWIIIGVTALALGVVIVLAAKYWKKLRLLDLDAMPKANQRKKKYQLIEKRLQRKTEHARHVARQRFAPLKEGVFQQFRKIHESVVALERKYRHAMPTPTTQEEKEKLRQKIVALMESGEQLYKEGNYTEAEHIFLDIIRLNPKHVEAYEYLGEVYFQKKEYEHAVETLEFARQLNPKEDRIYYDLGMIYQTQGMQKKALSYFKQAVKMAPNPRNLDALLMLAIEMKERIVARMALRQLQEVNPENQKIPELEKMIKEM